VRLTQIGRSNNTWDYGAICLISFKVIDSHPFDATEDLNMASIPLPRPFVVAFRSGGHLRCCNQRRSPNKCESEGFTRPISVEDSLGNCAYCVDQGPLTQFRPR
jgi:hypothetical protein